MSSADLLNWGREVICKEAGVLTELADSIDGSFAEAAQAIDSCEGKVALVGMGKPGRVNGKVAATFCSLGIPSFVLHPGEAMHGDLGVLQEDDLAIVVSYSGESDEVTTILPLLKRYASRLVAVTGNPSSTLAQAADICLVFPRFAEADGLGLAPTASTTAWIALADALAVAVSSSRGFTKADFGAYHPAGSLGKRLLLKVDNLMADGERNALIVAGSPLTAAIEEIGRKGLGITSVVNDDGSLAGVVTDGDLRRQLQRKADVYSLLVDDIMSIEPVVADTGMSVVDAIALMRERNVSCLPVVEGRRPIGTIQLQAIVDAGIVV